MTSPYVLPDQSAFSALDGFVMKTGDSPEMMECAIVRSPNPIPRSRDRSLYSPTPRVIPSSQDSQDVSQRQVHISFSEFEVLERIGNGAFGEVFMVRSPIDYNLYAIKKLEPYRGTKDRARRLREVTTVRRLGNHDHIVQYIDGWEENGCLHIQLVLCPEGPLSRLLLQEQPLLEDVIWNFFLDVTLGLKHLHDNGILHLDIKPSNIFITRRETSLELKLGDFGLAIDESKVYEQWQGGDEGDAAYMAPELLTCKAKKVARPADIFSLGCTLFEMASHLKLPTSGAMWQLLRSGDLTLSPHIGVYWYSRSEELRQFCAQLLHPEPNARPTVDDILALPRFKTLLYDRYDEEVPFPPITRRDSVQHRRIASRASSVTDLWSSTQAQSMDDDAWLMSGNSTRGVSPTLDLTMSRGRKLPDLPRPSFLSLEFSDSIFDSSEFSARHCEQIKPAPRLWPEVRFISDEEDDVLQ
ncbi:hypothetical protein RCL1_001801 [Eukaryota sp. TZLM3-RCL]